MPWRYPCRHKFPSKPSDRGWPQRKLRRCCRCWRQPSCSRPHPSLCWYTPEPETVRVRSRSDPRHACRAQALDVSSGRPTTVTKTIPLPDREGAEHRQRQDDETEIEPGPISHGILGQDEDVDDEPEADASPQGHADHVARRFPERPHVLDLWTCDTRGNDDENGDEKGPDRQSTKPDARRYFCVGVVSGLRRAHGASHPGQNARYRRIYTKIATRPWGRKRLGCADAAENIGI